MAINPHKICSECKQKHEPEEPNTQRFISEFNINWMESTSKESPNPWGCPLKLRPKVPINRFRIIKSRSTYPPQWCPFKVELIMLKDAGHPAPKEAWT